MKRKIANVFYLLSLLSSTCVVLVVCSLLLWVFWRGISVLDLQLFLAIPHLLVQFWVKQQCLMESFLQFLGLYGL